MTPDHQTIVAARRQLHAVAENFIAGTQYRAAGTIRLAARSDGFTGTALAISVVGTTLVWPEGQAPLAGPVSALVQAYGLDAGPPPAAIYQAVADLPPDAVFDIDPDAAVLLYRALYAGQQAMHNFLPEQQPVLWPEHFDVGAVARHVNYGVAAGDDYYPLPYAYAAPWDYAANTRPGSMWTAPFGALHPLDTAADHDVLVADIVDFFRRAQSQL